MTTIVFVIALLAFLGSTVLYAQSQSSSEEDISTAQSELELPDGDDRDSDEDVSVKSPPASSPESVNPEQQSNTQASTEVFKPTEEIIEDNAVSFPVDI